MKVHFVIFAAFFSFTLTSYSQSERKPVDATRITLQDINNLKTTDADLLKLYRDRISQNLSTHNWVSVVDKDIYLRPDSARALLELLTRPPDKSTMYDLWMWMRAHPDYPQQDSLLQESIRLYQAERRNWDVLDLIGFANLLSDNAPLEQASPLLNQLAAESGGMGIDIARERFQLRREQTSAKTPLEATPPLTASRVPQSDKSPVSKSKPAEQTGSQQAIIYGALFLLVIAAGLAWKLLTQRRSP